MLLVFMHVLFPAGSGCGICQSMAHAVQFVQYVGCCAKQNDHHHHHHHLGKVGFLLGKVVFLPHDHQTPNPNSELQLTTPTPNSNSQTPTLSSNSQLQLPTPTPNPNFQLQLPTPPLPPDVTAACRRGSLHFTNKWAISRSPQKHKKTEQTVVCIVTCSWYFECTFHENHNPSPSIITITITIIIIITITQLSFKAQVQ